MARKNLRQTTALKTTLRLGLVAAVTATAGLVALLIIVFNITREEEGRAQSSMTFKQATVFQDTTKILRGSINQKVIGLVVETNGKGTPVKISSMTFTARGTSLPVENNIENARLWYTGNDPSFSLQQNVGATVAQVTDKPIVFSASQTLLPGKNYFWLSFDVKPEASAGPGTVDATCQEIRIGAISYLPIISDPMGKRFVQANVPYYSMGNYAVNKVNSWNSRRDGSGMPPRQMSESRNSYFIQAGHRMISSTGSSLQTLVVEKGGELRITSPLRLNTMMVACGGVVQMDTSIYDFFAFNEMQMENGAMYIHNNTGLFPGFTCNFDKSSSQVFFRYGSLTFRKEIEFGNLVLDAEESTVEDLGGKITRVKGDFEIRKTGSSPRGIVFTGNTALQIDGNFIQTGGIFSGSENGTASFTVGGDLILKGGKFTDVATSKSASALQLKIVGDLILLNGSFITDISKMSSILITGPGNSRWLQKPACQVRLGNMILSDRHSLQIKGDEFGEISKDRSFTVTQGAELYCEQVEIKGDGAFILEDKAVLGIGHAEGIYTHGDLGNIQTAKRLYHSGATYYYYTSSQPQQTGVFATYPRNNAVFRLIVNKTSPTQVLNLSQNLSVEDQCKVNLGDLRYNGFELKVSAGLPAGLN
ncbi:MAG: hypothetical protein JNL88_11275 [Bacteroidia bacterium]|nr:hypothetical protein [Bacteroidia bacterium]